MAVFTSIACLIAAASAATARETYHTDIHDLGYHPQEGSDASVSGPRSVVA